jgi:hypothetical protein
VNRSIVFLGAAVLLLTATAAQAQYCPPGLEDACQMQQESARIYEDVMRMMPSSSCRRMNALASHRPSSSTVH